MDVEQHVKEIAEQGYTIVERAIKPSLLRNLNSELEALERFLEIEPSPNSFEGHKTLRIYNLLAYGKVWQQVPVYDKILPIVDSVLDPGCLISSLSSIDILPGEIAQPIHADDQLIPIAKPHVPIVCNSMWALTDFTDENGATRIIPGSHLRDCSPDFFGHYDSIPAAMPKGSVMIYNGSLWHGGGANRTDRRRIGVAMNYCAGYIRQQENQQLGIPREVAAQFSPRLQELIGYGLYNGLIGHIDKTHPAQLLGRKPPDGMVWDAATE